MHDSSDLRAAGWMLIIVSAVAPSFASKCAAQEAAPARSAAASIDELLLFFPTKYPTGDWQPEGLRFDDVWFAARDRTRLHGWYCPHETPRATILILHGNAGHLAMRAPLLKLLHSELSAAVFIFDYRGYGRSAGEPSVEGALEDARAARQKVCELAKLEHSDVMLMGESLGGAFAVQLAAESAPRALVLQSTFSSLRDAAHVHFPALAWLVPRRKLNSAAQIARYHGPLLQSHGEQDTTIPLALGEKLFSAANAPKKLVKIARADHNDWLTEKYVRELDQFLKEYGKQP